MITFKSYRWLTAQSLMVYIVRDISGSCTLIYIYIQKRIWSCWVNTIPCIFSPCFVTHGIVDTWQKGQNELLWWRREILAESKGHGLIFQKSYNGDSLLGISRANTSMRRVELHKGRKLMNGIYLGSQSHRPVPDLWLMNGHLVVLQRAFTSGKKRTNNAFKTVVRILA